MICGVVSRFCARKRTKTNTLQMHIRSRTILVRNFYLHLFLRSSFNTLLGICRDENKHVSQHFQINKEKYLKLISLMPLTATLGVPLNKVSPNQKYDYYLKPTDK